MGKGLLPRVPTEKKAATLVTRLRRGIYWIVTYTLSWVPEQPRLALVLLFAVCFWKSSISVSVGDPPISKADRNVTTDSNRNVVRAPVRQFSMLEIHVICI